MKTRTLIKLVSVLSVLIFTLYISGCGKGEEMGIGPIKEEVKLAANLDKSLVDKGQLTFNTKCASCHKFDSRLVGPPLKDVTKRRRPEWIMNFITNTDEMLNKDPKAQAQLEICLVRMPNQNLSDDDARALYEFQRKNDGVK